MIERALVLKEAINRFIDDNDTQFPELAKYSLSSADWTALQTCHEILRVQCLFTLN